MGMGEEQPLDYATPRPATATAAGADAAGVTLAIGAGFAVWTVVLGSSAVAVPCAIWVACPYLYLAGAAWFLATGRAGRLLVVLAAAAMAVFGVFAFDAVDEDAQGALVLLFAPIYQFAAAVVVSLVLLILRHAGGRRFGVGLCPAAATTSPATSAACAPHAEPRS
jgi:hypothetical protein